MRGATIRMATISAAKIAQISQLAACANVFQVWDYASRSTMSTGIIANVAARISGSNGVVTRPEEACCHIEANVRSGLIEPCLCPVRGSGERTLARRYSPNATQTT